MLFPYFTNLTASFLAQFGGLHEMEGKDRIKAPVRTSASIPVYFHSPVPQSPHSFLRLRCPMLGFGPAREGDGLGIAYGISSYFRPLIRRTRDGCQSRHSCLSMSGHHLPSHLRTLALSPPDDLCPCRDTAPVGRACRYPNLLSYVAPGLWIAGRGDAPVGSLSEPQVSF